jgi:simple sugar transport system permease protein
LIGAGFGCRDADYCALLTTLQFATPLLLTGLSATVAFHAGLFSVGQAGQMLLGAAAAASLAASLDAPGAAPMLAALAGGAAAGALWSWIPGVLKVRLGINEVIVTLVMNQLAGLVIGQFWLGRVPEAARLAPIAQGTKLSAGVFLALLAAAFVYLWLRRSVWGYEQRMAGQAQLFARQAGIPQEHAVIRGMMLSGALAGLAGAVEVLGVHYQFVSTFSGGGGFDGVAVALLGQSQPFGVVFASLLLAGVRLGALNGLQIKAGVPRELGGVMIALMILFVSAEKLYRGLMHRRGAESAEI